MNCSYPESKRQSGTLQGGSLILQENFHHPSKANNSRVSFIPGFSDANRCLTSERRYEQHPLSSQAPFGSLELSRDNEKTLKGSFSKSDQTF